LFEEWFVRLKFPGHEHTKIVDGVPEGWEKTIIEEVSTTVGGGTPKTNQPEYWDGEITWITPTDVTRSKSIVLLDSVRKITEEGLKKSSTKLLPPETILMTSRATLCFFALMDFEVCTNQGFISVIPQIENARMYILFNLMSRKEEIISHASGSTFKEINKTIFRGLPIAIPDSRTLQLFEDFAYSNIKQVRLLMKQNQKLKQARDLLLPKLMSGEIAV
jgi:type I restriction enzyme S subunit